jgi:hypothetical protein
MLALNEPVLVLLVVAPSPKPLPIDTVNVVVSISLLFSSKLWKSAYNMFKHGK